MTLFILGQQRNSIGDLIDTSMIKDLRLGRRRRSVL